MPKSENTVWHGQFSITWFMVENAVLHEDGLSLAVYFKDRPEDAPGVIIAGDIAPKVYQEWHDYRASVLLDDDEDDGGEDLAARLRDE